MINISSISGIIAGANMAAYNSAKAGVRLLSKSVALHCAKSGYNIRCNSVHPTFIDTPILDKYRDRFGNEVMQQKLGRQVPIGRLGRPEEVGWALVFLASDEFELHDRLGGGDRRRYIGMYHLSRAHAWRKTPCCSLSMDDAIYFDLAGPQAAPTVCFTHSLNSDGGMWVEQLVPLLAAGYRVLRLDMRGHGGSAPVDGDYTMDALAADVKGALDVLDIKKVHYIGLVDRRHDRPGLRAGLPRPPAVADAVRHPALDAARLGGDLGRAQGDRADQGPGGAGRRHDGALVHRRVQEGEPGALARDPRHDQRHHARGLGGLHGGDPELQLRGPAATIKTPTLVICGDEDPGTPPDRNQLIASKIPGGRYEGIAKARHLPNVERPEQFNRIMMSWLAANRVQRRA